MPNPKSLRAALLPLAAAQLCLGAGGSLFLQAATVDAIPGLPRADLELDEVVVRGPRLRHLRNALVETEDRFFALYNELNKNDDYDVHCRMEAPLGTLVKRRTCRIAFVEVAEAAYGQSQFEQLTSVNSTAVSDPETVFFERRDDYIRNALEVINSDPRLIKLIRSRNEIERKLNEERKKRMKGHLIRLE